MTRVEEIARHLAAQKMGIVTGSRLPDDLWRQEISKAFTIDVLERTCEQAGPLDTRIELLDIIFRMLNGEILK